MHEEACELPAVATPGGVFDADGSRFPRLREMRRSIVLVRNRRFCDPAAPLADGDEIAFLPPVMETGVFEDWAVPAEVPSSDAQWHSPHT